ncbi:MAG: class I SAM-dependent methyltransferase [Phycisphaeraceae bacterium]
MCIACGTAIDVQKQDAFANELLQTLNHGVTCLMISLGHRAGLFDVLADGQPRTSDQLARDADLNERYVREWLGGMVASRIVERDPDAATHRLPPEHAKCLSRHSPTDNMAVFTQYVSGLGYVEDQILDRFRHGGGVPYSAYPRFHDVMEEDSGQSIVPIIVDQLVPLIPGLHERLTAGIDVLDIGCGRGRALIELARAYPASRFIGYDLSVDAIDYATRRAAQLELRNVRFVEKDLTDWHEPARFDWITALDAIHDQARPDNVLAAVREALRPGGVFFMQDIGLSSEPVDNIDHPLGAMLYGVSLMHCMTVSLAQGGMGLGAAWGVQLAERMLREAGFDNIQTHRFDHDVQNVYFVMQT